MSTDNGLPPDRDRDSAPRTADARSDLAIRDSYFVADNPLPTTRDFLEKLRAKIQRERQDKKPVTTYRLARALKCEWSTVRRWLKGQGSFSHALAAKIGDELDLPPEYVVACVEYERAEDPMLKQMWARMAGAARAMVNKVAGIGLAAILAAGLVGQAPAPVEAAGAADAHPDIHYANRRRRRLASALDAWRGRFGRWLGTWFPAAETVPA